MNWPFKKSFLNTTNSSKKKKHTYKEIRVKGSKHIFYNGSTPFTCVHSLQTPNWVRVSLSLKFQPSCQRLYTWILTPIGSYTILQVFTKLNFLFTQSHLNKNEGNSQHNSIKVQIQLKCEKEWQGHTKEYASEDLKH